MKEAAIDGEPPRTARGGGSALERLGAIWQSGPDGHPASPPMTERGANRDHDRGLVKGFVGMPREAGLAHAPKAQKRHA